MSDTEYIKNLVENPIYTIMISFNQNVWDELWLKITHPNCIQ